MNMSLKGIHRGYLKKYGGFMFKQWKERFVVLTPEGQVMVCRDPGSPADQVVSLQVECEAIVEGKDILDLPHLPPGGRRDCCLGLILIRNKFLLLLADDVNDCSQWLNMLRKVHESVSSSLHPWKRHQSLSSCITDRDSFPDHVNDKDPGMLKTGESDTSSRAISRVRAGSVPQHAGRGRAALLSPQHSPNCLRHGNSSDVRAVRALCLLMGGAAASSALASCSPASLGEGTAELPPGGELSGTHHACSQAADTPHIHSFDFEGDADFDAFDCGGFAF